MSVAIHIESGYQLDNSHKQYYHLPLLEMFITDSLSTAIFNDILHMSFLAGTHVFKAFPAYTTTEL